MIEHLTSFLGNLITSFWWVALPPFLLFIFLDLWLWHKREKYKRGLKWNLLEVVAPKEIIQTPKSMEQIFSAMHAIYTFGILPRAKWAEGAVENWMSFEIVGRAGAIHFYIRTLEKYRNLVESAVFSQYPEAEINLVPESEDYVNQFSMVLPNKTYDIWGTDFVLAREDGYPIRTYEFFEHPVKEEKRIDPLAIITEAMSRLESSEAIWLQFLIRPNDNSWIDKAKKLIAELMGEKKEGDIIFGWVGIITNEVAHLFKNFFLAWVTPPVWPGPEEEKKEKNERKVLTPGTRNIIEAIENKISKIGFDFVLRFVYIDRRDRFSGSNIASIMGAIRQENTNNMNAFRPNMATMTIGMEPFKNFKIRRKQRKLYAYYRTREFPNKFSVLSTEELATIYHYPIGEVKSPTLRRTMAKKGGPPLDLPIT